MSPAVGSRVSPDTEGYPARPEQAILFQLDAWDVNCPQHIPQKLDAANVAAALAGLQDRLDAAEAETVRLRVELSRLQLQPSLGNRP